MEVSDFYSLLSDSGIPAAHNVFLTPQTAPYILYRDDSFENITANSKTVLKKRHITIELYSKITQIGSCEQTVEDILDSFTTYTKDRAFDDEQELYVTYYNFYII